MLWHMEYTMRVISYTFDALTSYPQNTFSKVLLMSLYSFFTLHDISACGIMQCFCIDHIIHPDIPYHQLIHLLSSPSSHVPIRSQPAMRPACHQWNSSYCILCFIEGMVSSMQIDGMFISLGHRYASRNTRASISTRLNHAFNIHLMQAKMLWWCSVFFIDRMSIPRSLLSLSDLCIGLPQLMWPQQILACHVSRLPVR